jgi:hypothetical protein
LLTSLVVQDGGLVGAIFNLVALAALVSLPSRYGARSGGPSLPQCSAINRNPPNSGLLADTPVNTLTKEIGMTVVAGVLLDHVNQELPQRDGLTRAVSSNEAEVGLVGELVGKGNLIAPCGPRVIDNRLIGHCTVEITVRLGVGLVAIRDVLASEPLPEPLTLHFGQVPHQTEQRQRRGLDRTPSELAGVQTLALELQRKALTAQVFAQRGTFVTERGAALARVRLRINEPVGAMLWLGHGTMI